VDLSNAPKGLTVGHNGDDFEVSGTCSDPQPNGSIRIVDASNNSVQVLLACVAPVQVPEPDVEYKSYFGVQQSQASASDRTWKIFGDLGISTQITGWSRFLVDLDLTSVPQQVSFNVSQATSQAPALVKNLNINQAVQSINLLVGTELYHFSPQTSKLAIKGLFMGGFSTPLSPKEAVQIYNSTQAAFNTLGITADPTQYPYLALTTPDRSRFYAQYYAGLRMKLIDPAPVPNDGTSSNYPAYFDVSFGQNSAVTGGDLRRFVWRFSGFLPIPNTPFAVIGTSYTAFQKNSSSSPLFLSQPSTTITLPNSQAYVFAKAENRDYYEIGVALDLESALKTYLKKLVTAAVTTK
jgi:hypothetical protein